MAAINCVKAKNILCGLPQSFRSEGAIGGVGVRLENSYIAFGGVDCFY
jgi:hypothetical protein